MLTALDNYYYDKPEPIRGCLLALKAIIEEMDSRITPEWKYGMPFFYLDGKMFCYLWKDKITGLPYIGFMNGNKMVHPKLEVGNRARVKVYAIDPKLDLPMEEIQELLQEAIEVA